MSSSSTFDIWHQRFGHPSTTRLQTLQKHLRGFSVVRNNHCDVCHFSKQKKLSFPISTSNTSKPFELIHVNIWGPFSISSIHNHKYFLTIVDDYTRYTWLHLLQAKSQVRQSLQWFFFSIVETQFSTTIKIVRSDNVPEFDMPTFYVAKGTIH